MPSTDSPARDGEPPRRRIHSGTLVWIFLGVMFATSVSLFIYAASQPVHLLPDAQPPAPAAPADAPTAPAE